MTKPNNYPSTEYQPSQKELKGLYDGILEATKNPRMHHDVQPDPDADSGLVASNPIRKLPLRDKKEAQGVLDGPEAEGLTVSVIEPHYPGYEGFGTIIVDSVFEVPGSLATITRHYTLSKAEIDGKVVYDLRKNPLAVDGDSFEAEHRPRTETPEGPALAEIAQKLSVASSAIMPDDIAMLDRLARVI